MAKMRLDLLLVGHNYVATREIAQFMIMTGKVLVNDQKITKSGQMVRDDSHIRMLAERPAYVSRGAYKLASALDCFGIDVATRRALDVGISTGGFTDLLLQRGIESVIGIDVGYGQVDMKIRRDPRVAVFERVNMRTLAKSDLLAMLDRDDVSSQWLYDISLVVMDVSFISVTKILPAVLEIAPMADYVVLIKPQFEAQRHEVGKGGIVRDIELIRQINERVHHTVSEQFDLVAQCPSGITGTKGNQEHFFWLKPNRTISVG